MLYRVNENAIVVSHRDGEVVVQLQKIFRVPVAGHSMYFVNAKSFRSLGFTDNGGRLVQEGNQISIFRVENISRKVILAKDEDVAGHPSYLVVDYLRRIFPVTPGTGRFFKERDGDNMWVPEGTRNQEIVFDSILGIAAGDWVIQFTTWRDA